MASFFIAGPLVVFLIFVAPLWLLLHYRSKRKVDSGLSEEEYQQLQTLSEQAKGLQQRVETLEKILDKEAPTWRG
ncbi:envelope stress response membrane protein PspB [Vibrio cincinnatiensis]|uniref:envelope stress response membrane protein PspB n=1 Tax=Vibrio cincinnatiensis TaxID=675 RepID=UPI001EE07810|nr:envelope stress response membrane protein PspB [Vibrio cincinnatiensis]MCG3728282.1 envelope stress response membrane protein PspB [Vibrio cincinnatiensis]